MNKHLSGNSIARVYILIADFAIMNAVVFVCWKGWIVDAPPFFDYATKIVAILANMSLLVASILHLSKCYFPFCSGKGPCGELSTSTALSPIGGW